MMISFSELKNLRLGEHLCYIYRNKEEQLSIVIPFMLQGLKKNEKCLYIVDENTKEEIIEVFRRFIDIDEYIKSKQFVILTKEEAYLKDGYFNPDKMIELLKDAEKQAIEEGYAGLRATGEMTWVFTKLPGVEKIIEYEAKLNYFFPKSRCVAICQYNENRFDAGMLLDVILTHPKLIIYDSLCENPYYIPPDVFLARMKRELSKEIYERLRNEILYKRKIEDKLKEKLRESEEMFRTLTEQSLVGIYLIQDGVFKYVNPKLAEDFGYRVDEIIGKDVLFFIHPEDRELVDRNLRLRIEGKVDSIRYKPRVIRKDGQIRTFEVLGSRTMYKDRPAIFGTAIDITEQENYRKKLEEYRRFYENAQDLFFILDRKGRFKDINPKFAEMLRCEIDELVGHTSKRIVHPEDLKRLRAFFSRVLKGKKLRDEFRFNTRDGKVLWFEVVEWPVFENDEVVKVEGVARDITKRIEMERRIRESEEKFRKIFENSPNIVAIVNKDGMFVEANPAVIESVGLNPIGKSLFEVFPNEVAKRRMRLVKKVLQQNESLTTEDTRDGRYFLVNLVPIELPDGKHCLVIAREMTELIRLNKLLNAINNINKLIVHEKDERKLLEEACEELASLEDYSTVTICLVEDEKIIPVAISGERKEILEKQKECRVIREALKCKLMLAKSEKACFECEARQDEFKQVLSLPMTIDGEVKGVITLYLTTDRKIGDEEMELLKTMAEDLAFAIKAIELDELKRKAYQQIEQNIEQFAILVDHIRNPLAAIQWITELEVENKETAKKIIKQVERIEDVIKRLDEGWLESEKIREFLRKYS